MPVETFRELTRSLSQCLIEDAESETDAMKARQDREKEQSDRRNFDMMQRAKNDDFRKKQDLDRDKFAEKQRRKRLGLPPAPTSGGS